MSFKVIVNLVFSFALSFIRLYCSDTVSLISLTVFKMPKFRLELAGRVT